jgi:nitrate reductase gamma subunit
LAWGLRPPSDLPRFRASRYGNMTAFLAIFTYFSYLFVIAGYAIKIVKYLTLPVHLRWDLYPVIHEEGYRHGGSYFEHLDWWTRIRRKAHLRGIFFLLREYFTLAEYMRRHLSYWAALYPWHIGFILIITFHILCFFGALAMVFKVQVSPESLQAVGVFLYYGILLTGVTSFFAGLLGSIGIIVNRLVDSGLKAYATPQNFVTYVFTLFVFASGLYAWIVVDPTFSEYREFWKGLITLQYVAVAPAAVVHILLFDLFLIYLPFTRSMHYITRFFAFFLIRWDDEPNARGSNLEGKIEKLLAQKLTWSAPHIQPGKTWVEAAVASGDTKHVAGGKED